MKLPALSQQHTALVRAHKKPHFAFFMEQGTGKAYVGLAEAEVLHEQGLIDALIVIAPNGVQRNWLSREAPKLLSTPHIALLWTGATTKKFAREVENFMAPNPKALRIAAFNIEAFQQSGSRAEKLLTRLLKSLRCYLVLDESSTIKNPSAACTRNLIRIGRAAAFRRIMTGTPITQSPLNFYSQFKFLGDGLLGFKDWVPFKSYFAEWRQRQIPDRRPNARPDDVRTFPELVRYRNLSQLKARADAHSFTILKKDCLDLPPKVYEERPVTLTPEQRALYTATKKDLIVRLQNDDRMTLAHAFTRLTRLSQIAGGFLKADEEDEPRAIPGGNPKIEALVQYVEELPAEKKVIVWARYRAELNAIADALGRSRCALYWGETDEQARHESVDAFQSADGLRFFVGNPKSGKYGLTLTAAHHMFYFSCDYSAEARWQSEDRSHRIGQDESLAIVDCYALGTIDERIRAILRERKNVADIFNGSKRSMIDWLENEEN